MRRNTATVTLLFSLLACEPQGVEPTSVRAFGEALAIVASEPEAAVARCQDTPGAEARDHCLASVAEAMEDPELAESTCTLVEDALWRDECRFLRAERRISRGELEEAARLCHEAGRFTRRCLTHVWREEVREPLSRGTVDNWKAAEARLVELISQDGVAQVRPVDGLPERWRSVVLFGFRQAEAVDVGLCDRLSEAEPEVDAEACVTLAVRVLEERLDKAWSRDGGALKRALCHGAGRHDAGAPWPGPDDATAVSWTHDPRLREGLLRAAERCERD